MKKTKRKDKEISFSMKYNPGTAKYEPELPLKRGRPKIKINWFWVLIILIVLILCSLLFFLNAFK
ncbi:hypothetical protein GF386_02150 [Candidatus Pacearchaeota archaeon]|nr:hypothetical protein [Candidatus Pacearchaeota archaeon]MBD3282970.1 hypothetical protein [Candidatus Pacearchaeota archaeon]